jgi:rhodanese-related sulfurtransferase
MAREEFVRLVTADLPEAPAYFARDAALNREGPGNLSDLPAPKPLSAEELEKIQKAGGVVLDTRPAAAYGTGHVPGSIHIGLSGQFASWAGTLLSSETPIVLIAEDPERVAEAHVRLARVGLDNVAGYLSGGVLSWHESGRPLARTDQISVDELARRLEAGEVTQLVDVRRPGEWSSGHIAQARHVPLHELAARLQELDSTRPVTAICAGGYRSSMATSVLERKGFRGITNVVGGMSAWNAAHLETVVPDSAAKQVSSG